MAGGARILVVDDEPQIRRFLRTSLGAHQWQVIEAETGNEAIRLATTSSPDLVVLDLGLPDIDGLNVIQRLREWTQVPIIVLSIRGEEATKVAALDRGADDYVVKPFGMAELLARIRATLRARRVPGAEEPVLHFDALTVDLARRLVSRGGETVTLSPREYDLLRALALHAGKVVTHAQLLRAVWGPAHAEDVQYLRVYVGQLRAKLEDDPARPRYLLTEPGVGYRFRAADEAPTSMPRSLPSPAS